MTNAIGSAHDPVLQPAAAAARPVEAGAEAARKALDQAALEGRDAVQVVRETAPEPTAEPDAQGRLVDRTA
jgi:hypothetical protein